MQTEKQRRAKRSRWRYGASMLVVFLLSFIPHAGAAKRVAVAQLEQAVTAAQTAHRPDADIAHQIAGFELSERLTEATLQRLTGYLDAAPQAVLALQLLADQSAFLDPPASELPATAAPDDAAQQRMIAAARTYIDKTVPQLPNLFATRITNRYDDRPQELKKGGWPVRAGLHLVNTSSQEISVFDERSNESTTSSASLKGQSGLVSGGEFGSTLSMILADSLKGKVNWSHWEQDATGPVAVFHYAVPGSASHFEVINTLPRQASLEGTSTSRNGSRQGSGIDVKASGGSATSTFITRPGYHGSLWVDPGTGAILRTTMDADTKGSSEFKRAAIMIQYGGVRIGESEFICPVHSLALSLAVNGASLDPLTRMPGDAPTQWLNESQFTGYHRFGTTTRIVQDAAPAKPHDVTPPPGQVQEVSPPSANPVAATQTEVIPDESNEAKAAAPDLPAPLPAVAPVQVVPAQPAPPDSQNTPATIEVNVNRALVPIVVRDRQGHAVGDLKKEDFQVFDRGKAQVISAFTVEKREVAENAPSSGGAESAASAPPQPAVLPKRINVYLFDDLHLSAADLTYLKKTDASALDVALANSDIAAVVSTSGKVNSGLTGDRTKLQDAITSLQPRGLYTSGAGDCPKIEYYQADLIENKHDSTAFANAVAQVFICDPALDRQRDLNQAQNIAESAARRVLAVGEQDVQGTLATIKEVVRRMAKLPGQRTLILVSPGFASIAPEALNWESQIIDLAARSNVTINALDARGLYVGTTDIGERGTGQVIDPTHLAAMTRAESVMSELADGTGGAFFHNSNDLRAGWKSVTAGPEYVYVLELSLNGVRPDGSYHRVQVKVDREGMQVQARQGYSAPKQEKK